MDARYQPGRAPQQHRYRTGRIATTVRHVRRRMNRWRKEHQARATLLTQGVTVVKEPYPVYTAAERVRISISGRALTQYG